MNPPTRLALAAVVLVAALGLPAAAPARAQPTSNLDVVLAIDNSGSMRGSDPDGLRWSAAQLFVDLASPGDRIGALAFASDVTPLGLAHSGRLTPIQDRASRETLKQDLTPRAPEGETNMQAAMRLALDLLGAEPGPNRRIVVFLTDGVPEPDSQRPQLAERIAEAGTGGVTVFPILLGDRTDAQVAAQMVRDTGGLQQKVDDPPGLLRAFGRIYTFIRPERYADELPTTGYGLRFQTNPAQAITQVSVVIPRPGGNFAAITSLGLSGQEVLGRDVLDDGALVARAEATHYQLVTVQHNRPLAGEWVVGTGPNAGGFGLLLASSAIGIELAHPVTSVTGSFVAPRLIPAGRSALLIARATQNGGELGDLPLSVIAESGQTLPLESRGLSPNHSLYWRFLDLSGARQRIEVQVGSELSPFRLRKEFVMEGAGVPHLVLDSPSASESGIAAGGRLRVAAHFEGGAASGAAMTAYIHDVASGEVTALGLACVEARCEDQSFLPQPGRTYRLVIAATGSSEGRAFSDGAEAQLTTGEVVRVDGADALTRLAALTPGDSPAPVPVTVTAFLYSGMPQLTAQLTDLRPLPSGLSAETFGVVLSALTPQAGGTYAAELKLRGFDRLPPGEYSAAVQFAAGEVQVVPAAVNFTLRVIRPQARLPGLPNPLSFGLIPDLSVPQTIAVQADFGEGAPFDLAAVVTSLTSALGPESPDRIQVDLGRPEPSGSSGRFSLSLRLSALRALPPGEYSGVLRFIPARPDSPASVEPPETRFEFRIPQPALALTRIGIPGDPVGCPQLGLRALPPDLVDFGAFRAPDRPAQVDLEFEGTWISATPQVEAQIVSLRRLRRPDAAAVPVRLEAASLQNAGDGRYVLPLLMELPPGQAPGIYVGDLRLASAEAAMGPATLRFQFDARTNPWGRFRQWARPATCVAVDWFAVMPFPRFKGFVGWGVMLVLGVVVWALVREEGGYVTGVDGDAAVRFTARRPAYVLPGEPAPRLSRRGRDSPLALIEIVREAGDEGDFARVRPRSGIKSKQLSYWSTRWRGWRLLPGQGRRLSDGDRFSVRAGERRYEFTIMMQ